MRKWDNEDTRSVVAFAGALLPGILTITIKNGAAQLGFLFLALLWLIIFYKGGKNKLWLCGLGIGMAAILWVSVLGDGSAGRFWKQIADFIRPVSGAEEESDLMDDTLLAVQNRRDQMERQNQEEEMLLEVISRQLEDTSAYISVLSSESGISRTDQENRQEVEQILTYIQEDEDELIQNSFPNLKNSREEIERFFKTHLTHKGYYYDNVIEALEEYGIDCRTLQIDKFDLARWDVEILYIFYRMKRSLEPELSENKFYTKKEFSYNDFSVKDVEGYQDVFDYQGWKYPFTDKTAQEIDDWFDNRILTYYDNFHKNFGKE